ncbi:MAG: hypothetical protein P9M00_08720, partial [Candidatus Tritonobacter lacicola]|nr:hypothetical protein [Candidatus Tritonobacter lacicola]
MKKAIHAFLIAGFIAISTWTPAFSQQLEIHTIDVGQGASELIIGPSGTTVLVDGGTSSKGRWELLPYLNTIFPPENRTLDYVIASHDDGDHYGGLNYILDNGYSANNIYHCGYNSGFGRGVPIPIGTVIDLGGGARVTCVLVNGYLIDGSHVNVGTKNNASIGLLIEYGDFDYITAGDLGSSVEDDLAQVLVTYINPPDHPYHPNEPYLDPQYGVDVMHPNHHGSRYSTSTTYVNLLRCEVAAINGGTGYSHPTQDAVDRLLGRQFYTCSCCSAYGEPTGVTVPAAEVYRTTPEPDPGDPDCERATEEDCPTISDIIVKYGGGSSYSVEGASMGVSYRNVDENGSSPLPVPLTWPMFRHDPARTGASPFWGPRAAELKWSYNLGLGTEWSYSSP